MKSGRGFEIFILVLVAIVAVVAIVAIVFLVLNSQDSSSVVSDTSSKIDDCIIEMNSSITGGALVSCPNFEVRGGTVVRR